MTQARDDAFEQESELVPKEPPPAVFQAIAGVVIALVAAAVAVSLFVALPETVRTRFILIPTAGADPIKAPGRGTLESVQARPGSEVREAEVLFTIRSEDLDALVERIRRLEREVATQSQLDASIRRRHQVSLQAAEVGAKSLEQELAYVGRQKSVANKLLEMAEASFGRGLSSQAQLLQARRADADAGQAYERLRREAEEAKVRVSALRSEQEREIAERALVVARLEGELAENRALLAADSELATEGDRERRYIVRAPYHGTVTAIGPRQPGAIIERGELLCRIARADAALHAQVKVPELEAGRVVVGGRTRLQFDAFPYTRYGSWLGQVTWLSPTAEEGAIEARIDVQDPRVIVDGVAKPLRAGMQGWAKIDVGRRTLATYVLEPLRQLSENARRNPQGGD